MNIQGSGKRTRITKSNSSDNHFWANLGIAFQALIFIAILGGIGSACVYLNQRVDRVERQIASVRRSIHNYDREIEHLKNRSETLKGWTHISKKIAEFNLQLRPARPGQVQQMVLLSPRTAQERANRVLAYRR